jgi:type VII secretion integral membrane protein EccD
VPEFGGDLCRVTVVGSGRRADVALPAEVALAEVVPTLLRSLLGDARTGLAPGDTSGWVLQRLGEAPLDLAASVATSGIRQGDLLQLRRKDFVAPPLAVDDLVDAIGTAARGLPARWSAPAARTWAVVATVALLVAGALAAATAGPPAVALCAVLSGLLVTTAGVVSRAAGRAEAALIFALAGTGYAFVAGMSLFGRSAGAVLVGAAAVLPVLAVAALLVPTEAPAFIAVGVAAGCVAVTALAGLLIPGSRNASAVAVSLGVLLAPWLPAVALRLSGLPMPALPTSRPELSEVGTPVSMAEIDRGARLADRLVTSMLAALCLVTVAGGLLLVRSPGLGVAAVLGTAALAVTLRGRHFPGLAQRQWAYGSGLVLALEFAGSVIVHSGQLSRAVAVGGLVAIAAALALTGTGRRHSPALGRFADLVEVLAVLATLPAAALALGVFDTVLALGG